MVPTEALAPARLATPESDGHAIHAYFNICPESPDGNWLVYFHSREPTGERGELRLLDRRSAAEPVTLATELRCEDAHRVACQQWIGGSRFITWHHQAESGWQTCVYDRENGRIRVLARDRLSCWGSSQSPWLPVYGLHWEPAAFKDLELIHVESGERQTILTAERVRREAAEYLDPIHGDRPIAIFFPILSPDGRYVMFKPASATGTGRTSMQASIRRGLFIFDRQEDRLSWHEQWGHPAWHPRAGTILNVPNVLLDVASGDLTAIPQLQRFAGSHPSFHPDGERYATDTRLEAFGGPAGWWGLVIAAVTGESCQLVHRFDQRGGATSWRPPHPHPVFSADGRRLYANVNHGPWTRLVVLETPD